MDYNSWKISTLLRTAIHFVADLAIESLFQQVLHRFL
jgi:hypothetical protein